MMIKHRSHSATAANDEQLSQTINKNIIMDKKVKITGALDYQKLNELSNEQKDDFIRKDIERVMNFRVVAHEKDEEPHYYNKDDSYSITADYSIVGKFYKNEGHLTATATYKYGTGAKIKNVEYQSA